MSDHWICFIPRAPLFVPREEAIRRASALLAEIAPTSDEIASEVSDSALFRDCGGNFESIHCPECDAQISEEWWSEQMDSNENWIGGPEVEAIRLSCGHNINSLNDLRYHFDQGFSRFILKAMNPKIGTLTPAQVSRVEEFLGCPVRVIYQHI
jgi:hypothetical protein